VSSTCAIERAATATSAATPSAPRRRRPRVGPAAAEIANSAPGNHVLGIAV
jgi:hypothetical protein